MRRPLFLLVALGITGCTHESELYCTASQPCAAGLPVCDVDGLCTGVTNTCIAADQICWDAGVSLPDAATEPDAGIDAAGSCGECDNGLFCDGEEVCAGDMSCQAGAAPAIDDGIACTVDSCDEATDSILHEPDASACDNGKTCDGQETCSAAAGCVAGQPVQCPATTACTAYTCSEPAGSCLAGDRAYVINYASPSGSGNVGLTCGSSSPVHTYNTSSCEWTCFCSMNAQAQVRVTCEAVSTGGGICTFRPPDPESSGCSSTTSFGGIDCCFP